MAAVVMAVAPAVVAAIAAVMLVTSVVAFVLTDVQMWVSNPWRLVLMVARRPSLPRMIKSLANDHSLRSYVVAT